MVYFSKNSDRNTRETITDILQIPQSKRLGKYQGCSNIDYKRTKSDFDTIKERIKCKLAGWKARFLSQAGKIVLINSNLTGIPHYIMQGIRIPNYIAKDMDRKSREFVWQNNMDPDSNHGSLNLVSWDKICGPRCEGGLGIRKYQDINAANLAKLGWKVLTTPENLWVQVVLATYLSNNNFMEVRKTVKVSRMWKYILDHRYLLKKGIRWVLGMVIELTFGKIIGWLPHLS